MRKVMIRLGLVGAAMFAFGCGTAADAPADAAGYVAPGIEDSTGGGAVECSGDTECVASLTPGTCATATCDGGTCVLGSKPAFAACTDDGLTLAECQTGRCDGGGTCVASAANDGQPCGASDACQAQLCAEGACQAMELKNCNDANPCTDDQCDPASGCVNTNNTTACDDGNACTDGDACADGQCAAGPDVCECFEASDCDNSGLDQCTTDYACESNKCVEVPNVVTCIDPGGLSQCEINACNPATGQCETQTNENAACDDGDACTTGEFCAQNGNCISGAPVVCPQTGLEQCEVSACNAASGQCETESKTDETCDDGNPCTDGDTCSGAAVCIPGLNVTCEALCIGGIDEDNDGDTDCADDDCSGSAVCGT
jgi:hypothetical protein